VALAVQHPYRIPPYKRGVSCSQRSHPSSYAILLTKCYQRSWKRGESYGPQLEAKCHPGRSGGT